jgi:para-aminobenzoate synthetase component 1
MRTFLQFSIEHPDDFTNRLLRWGSSFRYLSFMNSNKDSRISGRVESNSYDLIAAIGAASILSGKNPDRFEALKEYHFQKQDWLFGHLSYDLKNQTENLSSENEDGICFPEIHFFQARYLFLLKGNHLSIGYLGELSDEKEIRALFFSISNDGSERKKEMKLPVSGIAVTPKIKREAYIETVHKIKQHINLGEVYELNFCMEFFAEGIEINPVDTYLRLNEISKSPFSVFYRLDDRFLLSASPERFLKKSGNRLLSQPMKGTCRRGASEAEDKRLKDQLSLSRKEQNENVMIVDLVRNDLSRSAKRGSVVVEELFGVYSFKQVHQMISSISAELEPDIHFVDAIKYAFPMGSMTGAPKVKAMELIEQYESTRRGLYSGAVGYLTENGDFDFNVVIRSILYNHSANYLSFTVGSAITSQSDAQQEYEECLLKAKAMLETLNHAGAI